MKMYSKTEVKKQGLSITLSTLLYKGTLCVKKELRLEACVCLHDELTAFFSAF